MIVGYGKPKMPVMTIDLQAAIFQSLYEHFLSSPGSRKMDLAGLYKQLFGISTPSDDQKTDFLAELFGLEKKRWVEYEIDKKARSGSVWITGEGIKVAKQASPKTTKKQNILSMEELCPPTFEKLLQQKPDYKPIVYRHKMINDIINYISRTPFSKAKPVVLHGQPRVGKTQMLHSLSNMLPSQYVPFVITLQGNKLDNLGGFVYDLAIQLNYGLKSYHQFNHDNNEHIQELQLGNYQFINGNSINGFHQFWNDLRQTIKQHHLVIMFDEIEHLLGMPQDIDKLIFSFLQEFIRAPDRNGYFILVGSSQIHESNNPFLDGLIKNARFFRIRYFPENEASEILSIAAETCCTCEENTLQYFKALSDGHPPILASIYEEIAFRINNSSGKQKLDKDDIEPLVSNIMRQSNETLNQLWRYLTKDEQYVVKLLGQMVPHAVKLSDCYLLELFNQAEKDFSTKPDIFIRLRRGADALAKRGWISWKDRRAGRFHFKFGIIPLWVERHNIELESEG